MAVDKSNGEGLPLDNLRAQAVAGVGWNAAAKVLTQVIQFACSIVLARLIEPSAFGLVALLTLATGFAGTFADLGFGSAIIQRKDLSDDQLDTAFWASVALGGGIAVLMAAMATTLAAFFHEPELVNLAQLASLNFIFSAIGTVPAAILTRNFRFQRSVTIGLLGVITGTTVSLVMAIWVRGPLPLVVGPIVSQGVISGLCMFLCGWWPKLRFRSHAFGTLAHVGLYLTGYAILNYWSRNIDNLVIGKWLGAEPLAFYARAYSLMLLPITMITSVLASMLVPVLARIQHDKPRCASLFLRAQRTITFVTFPSMLGLSLMAEPFVRTVYGDNWLPMVPILRVLALAGMLQGMGNAVGWIYISQGRTDLMFRVGITFTLVTVLGIGLGAALGSALTVAVGYSLSECVLMYPGFSIPGRLIDLRVRVIVAEVMPAALCSAVMGAAVWLVVTTLSPHAASPVVLVVGATTGIVLYLVLAIAFGLSAMADLWQLFREKNS